MTPKRTLTGSRLAAVLVSASLVLVACDYIVPPADFSSAGPTLVDSGWAGIATKVEDAGGGLRVELSIVNNTNDWSAMDVGASTATVTDPAGKSHDCGTVVVGTSEFVNSGGWYLPPGFAMSGYTGGSAASPTPQPLHVECAGVQKAAGQTMSVAYSYIVGPFDYYVASTIKKGTFKLNLDRVVTDTKYPIAQQIGSLKITKPGDTLAAINNCTVKLTGVKRTDAGFEFAWESSNPTKYPAYVHIGQPPVIGSDGILYGFYQSPHLADAPISPAGDHATWTTTVVAPKEVTGFYLLVPVETQQQKYFVDHVVDITDK